MLTLRKSLRKLEQNFTIPRATIIIASLTLASRVLGLIRTRLFTSRFGASTTLDTYFTAFRIPDLLTNLLVLGTLSVAFLPVFTQYLVANKKLAIHVAQTVLSVTFLGIGLVALLGIVFAEPLTHLVAPGFKDEQFYETVLLTRIIFLSQIIFAISNIVSAMLNAFKRFLFAGIAPLLYNLGIIAGLLFFYPKFGIAGLGFGVLLGSILHLAVQIPEAIHAGFIWRWRLDMASSGIKKITSLYIPRIFALDLSQVSLFVGTMLGSTLVAGSISVFHLGFDLTAVPLGIFAISTAVAAYPALSESYAQGKLELFWSTISKSGVQILFFIIPVSIGLLVMRAHVVRLVYGAGQFNWEDTMATFSVLGILSCSLFAQSIIPLLSRALFARLNTKLPVTVGLGCTVLLAVIAILLTPKYGINGIAIAFTITSIINCGILIFVLHIAMHKELGSSARQLKDNITHFILKRITAIIFASIFMGIVAYALLYAIAPLVNTHTGFGILVQSGLATVISGLVFMYITYMLKVEQAVLLVKKFRQVFSRVF